MGVSENLGTAVRTEIPAGFARSLDDEEISADHSGTDLLGTADVKRRVENVVHPDSEFLSHRLVCVGTHEKELGPGLNDRVKNDNIGTLLENHDVRVVYASQVFEDESRGFAAAVIAVISRRAFGGRRVFAGVFGRGIGGSIGRFIHGIVEVRVFDSRDAGSRRITATGQKGQGRHENDENN